MNANKLSSLLLQVFLWLPVSIGCWYLLADYLNSPAVSLSGWALQQFFPAWVETVEWTNGLITLVTRLQVQGHPGVTPGQIAIMVAEVNPSIYSYGLPLFVALMLASHGLQKIHQLLLGCIMLIPFQAWGISFDLLKQVAITAMPSVTVQTKLVPWQLDLIALGYQFGSLIMPTLVPVVLWLAMNRHMLPLAMRRQRKKK